MAKRYSSKKGRKMEPAVTRLTFSVPSTAINGTHYIDLSQCASIVNRRFYRQGINWAVAGIRVNVQNTGPTASITVSKLPNTWVLANAWVKAFNAWQKMNKEALAENESVRPKFLDFKIYADAGHHTAGYVGNLLPWSTGAQFAPGEWESSKIHVPFATSAGGIPPNSVQELEMLAVGASFPGISPATGANAVGLIEGYAASRALPNVVDPNVPGDNDDTDGTTPENWMAALFNDGTQQIADVLTDMSLENNIAPYPFEGDGTNTDTMYPNGGNQAPGMEIVDQSYVTATTVGGTTRLQGSNFPCGLIRLDVFGFNSDTEIFVDLVPGSHRGYLCEPMGDM